MSGFAGSPTRTSESAQWQMSAGRSLPSRGQPEAGAARSCVVPSRSAAQHALVRAACPPDPSFPSQSHQPMRPPVAMASTSGAINQNVHGLCIRKDDLMRLATLARSAERRTWLRALSAGHASRRRRDGRRLTDSELHRPQAQCVAAHRDGTHAHRRARDERAEQQDDRAEQQAEERVEHPRCKRNTRRDADFGSPPRWASDRCRPARPPKGRLAGRRDAAPRPIAPVSCSRLPARMPAPSRFYKAVCTHARLTSRSGSLPRRPRPHASQDYPQQLPALGSTFEPAGAARNFCWQRLLQK